MSIRMFVRLAALSSACLLAVACRTTDGGQDSKKEEPTPEVPAATQETPPPRANRPPNAPRFIDAPATGDVAAIVKAEAAKAPGPLIIYAGATWCEPCQRFHHAVEQGDLDAQLASYTFLAFDVDRDQPRLALAGYASHYIPLFAVPNADGKALRHIEGSVTGPGSPGQITPRLLAMVAGTPEN